jgi:Family of unknown function (DUF5317)
MTVRGAALLVLPVVAGVLLGYAAGGRLSALARTPVRRLWLLWLAAGGQAAMYRLPLLRHAGAGVDRWLLLAIFCQVAAWLAVNLPGRSAAVRAGGLTVALGAALNAVPVLANGRMPYSPHAAALAGMRPGVATPKNVPGSPSTRFPLLGDVIPVPGLQLVASVGDVAIAAGTVLVIVAAMRAGRSPAPAPPSTTHERTTDDDPHTDLPPVAAGRVRAGGTGHVAVHDRRAGRRGR